MALKSSKSDREPIANIVKQNPTKSESEVAVFPNPVKNGLTNLIFNNTPKGAYQIFLYSSSGEKVMVKLISFMGEGSLVPIQFEKNLKGHYILKILSSEGKIYIKKLYLD